LEVPLVRFVPRFVPKYRGLANGVRR